MLKIRQALFPSLGLQMVDGGGAHGLARERVADPNKNGENINRHVDQVEIFKRDKSSRMQRHQHQFHTGEQPEAARDSKTDLPPRHSEKARKQEQEEDEADLHDANRALQSGEGVHQRIVIRRVREGDYHRNQQQHHTRPLEQQSAQIFQRVIGTKHVKEYLVNHFEAEKRVDRLAQPEQIEVHIARAQEPKRKERNKICNLGQQEQEKHGKL